MNLPMKFRVKIFAVDTRTMDLRVNHAEKKLSLKVVK